MKVELHQIIGTIQVNSGGNVWMICKNKDYDILNDYLNSLIREKERNEQLQFIENLSKYFQLQTEEDKWNYFEHYGGNDIDTKFGWLSIRAQTPNLLLNKNTKEIFAAYSIEDKIKIDKSSIISLIKNWGIIVDMLSPIKRTPKSEVNMIKEIELMHENLSKYISKKATDNTV